MAVFAMHVGCNDLDESLYPPGPDGWHLPSSITSANLYAGIVRGIYPACVPSILCNPKAEEVRDELLRFAATAATDDLVIFSFSGHGGRVPTKFPATPDEPIAIGHGNENLNYEVSILLKNRMMIANEFKRYLGYFSRGVRFFSIADGCGLGTFFLETLSESPTRDNGPPLSRAVPIGVPDGLFEQIYHLNQALYDSFIPDPGEPVCLGLSLGACNNQETGYQKSDGTGSFLALAMSAAMARQPSPATYLALREEVERQLFVLVDADRLSPMKPPLEIFGAATEADKSRLPFH